MTSTLSSHLKSLLKQVKDAIHAKDDTATLQLVESILLIDPENTTALLYKAVVKQHQQDWEASELILTNLLEKHPVLVQAWQGLEKIYEETKNTERLIGVLKQLKSIFESIKEQQRFTDTVNKLLHLYTESEKHHEAIDTLKWYLPNSDLYSLFLHPPSPGLIWSKICHHQTQLDDHQLRLIQLKPRKMVLDTSSSSKVDPKKEAQQQIVLTSPLTSYYEAWLRCEEPTSLVVDTYLQLMLTKLAYLPETHPDRDRVLAMVETWVANGTSSVVAYQVYFNTRNVKGCSDYTRDDLTRFSHVLQAASETTHGWLSSSERNEWIQAVQSVLLPTMPSFLSNEEEHCPKTPTSGLFPLIVHCLCHPSPSSTHAEKGAEEIEELERALQKALHLLNETILFFHVDLAHLQRALQVRQLELEVVTHQYTKVLAHLTPFFTDPPSTVLPSSFETPLLRGWRGEALVAVKRYHDALPDFLSIPSTPWVQSCLAWCWFKLGETDKAFAGLPDASLDGIPGHAVAVYHDRVGRMHVHGPTGDLERASRAFMNVVQSPTATVALQRRAFFHLGTLCYARSKARAFQCWEKTLTYRPVHARALEKLTRGYLENGQVDRAYAVLRMHAGELKTVGWVQKRLGFLHLQCKQYENAAATFQTAVRCLKEHEDVTVFHGLAEAYMSLGRFGAALKTMEHASQHSQDSTTLHLLAKAYLKTGQYEQSKHWLLQSGWDFTPNLLLAGEMYLLYARACFAMGRYGACVDLLQEGISVLASSSSELLDDVEGIELCKADLLAMYIYLPHHCETYVETLETACALYIKYRRYVPAAQVLLRLFHHSHTVSYVERGVALLQKASDVGDVPPSSDLWNVLGLSYVCLNRPRLAQHCFCASLHAESKDPWTWTYFGALCLLYHDEALAVKSFRQALLNDPDHTYAWFGLALSEPDQRSVHLNHVFTITPYLDPLGLRFYLQSPTPTSHGVMEKVVFASQYVTWDPTDASAWNQLGCYYELSRNTDAACHAFKTSLKLHRDPNVVSNLARVLLTVDPTQAQALYDRLQSMDVWHALSVPAPSSDFLQQCISLSSSSEVWDKDTKALLAQVCYRASYFDPVPALLQDSPAALCAFGLVQGHEALIHEAFPLLSPFEMAYFTSVYHVLKRDSMALVLAALQKSIHATPSDPVGWTRLAHCLGRYAPASLRSVHVPFPETHRMQAVGALAVGDTPTALARAQKHLHLYPYLEPSWVLLQLGFPHAPLRYPWQRPYSHLVASHASLVHSDVAAASHHVQAALAPTGEVSPWCWVQCARVSRAQGHVENAIQMYKQALSQPLAWLELVQLYIQMGWREAAMAFLQLDLHWPEAGRWVYRCLVDPASANVALDQLTHHSCSPFVKVLAVLVWKAQGFTHRAAKVLRGLQETEPELAELVQLA